MGGIACACASEECAVLGCRRVREIQRKALEQWVGVKWRPQRLPGGLKLPPAQLTESDIRRIVREEIANAMSSGVKP